jgi:glycyl-tRNA synthetase
MNKYDEIQKLADQRGLFFPSAEIHSALSGFWDFGPLGANVRRKIIEFWRKEIVRKTDGIEIEGCTIMPKNTFLASGHLDSFVDPVVQCKKCHKIYRADSLIEDIIKKKVPENLKTEEFDKLIKDNSISCPDCKGELDKTKKFNMMIGLSIGPLSKECNAYLRPETCQSIFTAFQKIYKTSRISLPIGIAQVGRVYRNEISPRQSLIRLREITQLELEVFFNPKKAYVPEYKNYEDYEIMIKINESTNPIKIKKAVKDGVISNELIAYYLAVLQEFFEKCGFKKDSMRFRYLKDDEKAFYSKETFDFEVLTSIGWLELVACNYRTDFDLKSHSKFSGVDLAVFEDEEKFFPHVFELSAGLDRIFYAIIENSLGERDGKPVLKLPYFLSSLDVVVLPLVKKGGIYEKALEIYNILKKDFDTKIDEKGSIGKRYLIYDQLGVPLAITVDYDSLKNDDVTIRDRDTTKQIRIKIKDLKEVLRSFFEGKKIFNI